jgi:hypothetical protein
VYKVQFQGAKLSNKKKDEKGTTPPGKTIEINMKVVECYVRDAEQKSINPAQQVGREMRKWLVAPGTGGVNKKGESTDEMGLRQIRAVLESIGHPAEAVDQVDAFQPGMLVQFGADGNPLRDAQGNYVGRFAYIHNVETNRTQDGDANYITPEKYELYRQNAWTPSEQGTPRQDGRGGQGGGNLPNVSSLPNVASAMTGINPMQAGAGAGVGTAPAAGLANPAFGGGNAGSGPPIPTQPTQGNGVAMGQLIK